MPGKHIQPVVEHQTPGGPQPVDYCWQDCDDFQIPDNSVWYGKDDDGSDIFCGKAYCEGQEVPAKIIPEKRECRVRCDSGEKVVPHCRKVLICSRSSDDHCHRRRRDHCHRRHRRHSSCSSSGSENEEESRTETTTNSTNECRQFVKSVKCASNSTTIIVKKNKTNRRRKGKGHRGGGCEQECWDEQRTRVVPRVTYEPRVRYEPRVTMERRVRYETENYTTRVCGERCRESSCEPCEPCEPCHERRGRRCREAVICERRGSSCSDKGEKCIRPDRCSSPPTKGRCW